MCLRREAERTPGVTSYRYRLAFYKLCIVHRSPYGIMNRAAQTFMPYDGSDVD